MAVIDLLSSQLRLVFYEGEDMLTGRPIFKSKTFSHIKPDASPDALLSTAEAFASIQEFPLYNVERRDQSELYRE